ncbi:hypothetical protein ACM64Y_04555 [Novispirillum sp. DQ9]|uniref:hypothetical protein n=1 Tax=Novispirillum sp. DQ9 TaxID=3398612 RepID=UPI003C7AD831
MPLGSSSAPAFPDAVINATVGAGSAILSVALAVGAGPAGGLALGMVLIGCAMSECNYYRGVYRVKPPEEP